MLVDREYVGNAVGLNSIAFNAPAVIGPALAGLLIVWIGVAGAFYFNAAATLAVVAAVLMMRPSPPSATRREPTMRAMRQGILFIARHPALRWIVLAQFVTALLARPYGQLIPALAVNVLHAGARGLGWAVSAIGIGGFGGALVTAYFAQRERRSMLWLQSGLLMSAGVFALAFVPTLALALPVLFAIGVGTLASLGATNTLDPDAFARRRARPRARDLHDDRDRRRSARRARRRRDRRRHRPAPDVCAGRALCARRCSSRSGFCAPSSERFDSKKASRDDRDSLK